MKHPWHLYGDRWNDPQFIAKALERARPWIESEFLSSGCDRQPTTIQHITYQPGFLAQFKTDLDSYQEMETGMLRTVTARRLMATVFYWRNHWGLIKK